MNWLARALVLAVFLALISGCMNLYVRCPGTDSRITTTYQSTQAMWYLSWVLAFPQTMSWGGTPAEKGLQWENVFTVPVGALGLCDTLCEGVVDTVLFPADWYLSSHRKLRDLDSCGK